MSDATPTAREAFLAGQRPDDVLVYVAAEAVSDFETLADRGERAGEGAAFVLDAERGRRVGERVLNTDPMDLAGAAMDRKGAIDLREFRGDCPAANADVGPDDNADADADTDSPGESHALRGVFAFAEERNEAVGGIYAEGDVIHAYAVCTCGTAYSDRWVASDR